MFGDPVVPPEARLDQAVVASKAVGGDLGGELDAAFDDGLKRCFRTVFHDLTMHPPAAFEDAEDRDFLRSAPPGLAALAGRAEVAFVDLDLTGEGAIGLREVCHAQPQMRVDRRDGLVVQPRQPGRPVGGDVEGKEAEKIAEFPLRNSPPKQIAVFLSHKSTLHYSQNHSAGIDPFEEMKVSLGCAP